MTAEDQAIVGPSAAIRKAGARHRGAAVQITRQRGWR